MTVSNTYTQARQHGLPAVAAIDGITCNLKVEWANWDRLRDVLAEAQSRARGGGSDPDLDHLQLGDERCRIEANGQVWGNGTFNGRFPFVLMMQNGTRVCLRDASRPGGRMPDVQIDVGGTACVCRGGARCRAEALDLLTALGATEIDEELSRLDLCVDVAGANMVAIREAWDSRHLTYTSCDRWCEGATVGFGKRKSGRRIQIYDKRAQVEQKANPAYTAAMVANRWGGQQPAQAIRLEFQLHTKMLRRWGVRSFKDFEDRRGDIVARLTRDVKVNAARPDAAAIVDRCIAGLQEWAGAPMGLPLEPVRPQPSDTTTPSRQLLGLLAYIAALEQRDLSSDDDVVSFAAHVVRRTIQDYSFFRQLAKCMARLGLCDR